MMSAWAGWGAGVGQLTDLVYITTGLVKTLPRIGEVSLGTLNHGGDREREILWSGKDPAKRRQRGFLGDRADLISYLRG